MTLRYYEAIVPLDQLLDSGQSHQHFTLTFFVRKFAQSQTLSRIKLFKRLLYQKCPHKMLMKLTLGCQFLFIKNVNFLASEDAVVKTSATEYQMGDCRGAKYAKKGIFSHYCIRVKKL